MWMEKTTNWNDLLSALKDPIFDRVLVVCHASPDGDAAGSAFSLAYALRKMGREARVFCPDPFGERFSYLTQEESELKAFEPKKIVTVDVASASMLGSALNAASIDVVIDHHKISTLEAPIKFVDPTAASCGEILVSLLQDLGVEFDAYLAKALYTAVATDTGCFRYSNTTQRTYLAAAYLSRFATQDDFYQINKQMFETKSRTQLSLEADAANRVQFAADGRIAYLAVSLEAQAKLGVSYQDLDTVINVIRQVQGVEVAIVAKERESGVFKVSVRSEKNFDASTFCALFGGGGHAAAAGCTLTGTQDEVLSALLKQAEERIS